MAKKKVYLHVGPADDVPGALHESLLADDRLAAARLAVPPVDPADLRAADLEIRRRHKAEGLRRKDVEGAWSEVCRAAFRCGSDVVISQPAFVEASHQQAALALDSLVGLQLHLVLTPAEDLDEHALAALAGPWARFVKHPGRIHQVPGHLPHAELARRLALLAVAERTADVERDLADLEKKRSKLRKRLRRVEAA
jgi:hypothetical protein